MLYEVSPSAGYMPTVFTMVNRAKLTAPRLIASIGQLYGDFSWAPLRNGASGEIKSILVRVPHDRAKYFLKVPARPYGRVGR